MAQATPYDSHLTYRQELLDVGPRFHLRTGLMRRMLRGQHGRLLDVGCGDGFFMQQLMRMGFTCAGLDVSAPMIERCRARVGEDVELYCGPIESYTPAQPFDVVACGEVLEHIEDDLGTLHHIWRLLRPGGLFVLSVPLDMRLWNEVDARAGHQRRYTKVGILSKLQQAGFRTERYTVWGWPITRTLHFTIRRQQKSLLSAPARRRNWRLLRQLMRWGRYVFLLDNLFNWTERGVGIVVSARR